MSTTHSSAAGRVAGGYALIPIDALCLAWSAYREGLLPLADFRAWLGCHELAARRCRAGAGRTPRYTLAELHRLVGGVGGQYLRATVRRLERLGLLAWAEGGLRLAPATDAVPERVRASARSMRDALATARRAVPVPRRMLRHLAGGAGRGELATVFGHLVRCLFVRRAGATAAGACKASWVASAFRVNLRSVKAARARLVATGFLVPCFAPQWYRNRFGGRVTVNTAWSVRAAFFTGRFAPPRPPSTGRFAPPESDENLLQECKNQTPAGRGPDGVRSNGDGTPTLRRVVPEDLADTGQLLRLFAAAVRAGHVRDCEADRLRFITAAEHARAVGTRNPCGLFAHLVRQRLWHFGTQAAEAAAAERLKRLRPEAGPLKAMVERLSAVMTGRQRNHHAVMTGAPDRCRNRLAAPVAVAVTHAQRTFRQSRPEAGLRA